MICTAILSGTTFSPSNMCEFWDSNQNNSIRIINKGDAILYGRGKGGVYSDSTVFVDGDLKEVLTFLEKLGDFAAFGVNDDNVLIYLTIEWKDQCNFEIAPDLLARLSKLQLTLGITCYESEA